MAENVMGPQDVWTPGQEWPPAPTLANAYHLVTVNGAVLSYWDRWCPDDGRPAQALKAIEDWRKLPEPRHPGALIEGMKGVRESSLMAQKQIERNSEGKRKMFSKEGAAYMAALSIHWLCAAMLNVGEKHTQLCQSAIEASSSAKLIGFMMYNDLDDDDGDEPEQTDDVEASA